MKFLIHNLTDETKSICRFGGKKVIILPNDYIEFEPNNDIESSYWATISRTNSVSGLNIIVDETRQALIKKLKRCGKLTTINNTVNNTTTNINVSNVDNTITSLNIDESNVLDTTIEETVNEPINNEPLQEIENVDEIISDEQVFDTEVEEVITDESITEDTTEDETNETDVVDTNNNPVEDTIETVVKTAEETTTNDVTDEPTITEDVESVETNVESDDIDSTSDFVKYSEEELNNMTKEELQSILNELGISYRKNNTNATLINLILEYYNSEE